MPAIAEHHKFVMTEIGNNHNKFWNVWLFDNDDVKVEWGRVGKTSQSKTHVSAGYSKMSTLIRSKERKGYTEFDGIDSGDNVTQTVADSRDLRTVAKEQIKHTSKEVAELIEWLAEVNRHTIMSATNLTFNVSTGMFSTPLGIVTPSGVAKARTLLNTIGDEVAKHGWEDNAYQAALEKYLMLIPQDVGMKRGWHKTFLPDLAAVQRQGGILDSLEASYRAIMSGASATSDDGANVPMEQVFDVQLRVVDDKRVTARINKFFGSTRNRMHSAYALKLARVLAVEITTVATAYDKYGKGVGGVKQLWHGTNASNLLSILKTGLIIPPSSSSNVTGRLFGNGLYFSDQSTKSLNYAMGAAPGQSYHARYSDRFFMFLADVAMGKTYTPQRVVSKAPSGYNSVFAKPGIQMGWGTLRNNEMIVYRTDQVNLVYLCEFGN